MLRHRVANHVFISGHHERGLRHEREQAGSPRASRSPHVWQSAVEVGDEDDEGVAQALLKLPELPAECLDFFWRRSRLGGPDQFGQPLLASTASSLSSAILVVGDVAGERTPTGPQRQRASAGREDTERHADAEVGDHAEAAKIVLLGDRQQLRRGPLRSARPRIVEPGIHPCVELHDDGTIRALWLCRPWLARFREHFIVRRFGSS
jgi:hypothetical protein